MNIENLVLTRGSHKSLEQGACIMEMVSYLANEPWSDHPQCACKALTAYAIRLNDSCDDAMRARLKALAPNLIGTRDSHIIERGNFLALQSINVMLPILTDALELKEISAKLREFKPGEWLQAKGYIHLVNPQIREAVKKHAYAATAYAYAATATATAAKAAADAYAAATAYADAKAAADATAYAKAAADAYAAATAYADAYTDAYAAAPQNKKFWMEIREKTFEAMFVSLEQAIAIGKVK